MPETPVPTTPVAGQGNEGDNKEKLIAGKFKTVEEAVEVGYQGLEKGFHELSQTVGGLVKILEAATSVPVLTAGGNDGYNRGASSSDDIDPAAFITNPSAHLKQRDAKLLNDVRGVITDVVGNMLAVSDFKSQNPDLLKHERIVQAFMKDQNPNLPVSERLANAGKEARTYIASLTGKASAGNNIPKGSSFVEGPSGGNPRSVISDNQPADEGEEELLAYVSERNADMNSHFGAPSNKK